MEFSSRTKSKVSFLAINIYNAVNDMLHSENRDPNWPRYVVDVDSNLRIRIIDIWDAMCAGKFGHDIYLYDLISPNHTQHKVNVDFFKCYEMAMKYAPFIEYYLWGHEE